MFLGAPGDVRVDCVHVGIHALFHVVLEHCFIEVFDDLDQVGEGARVYPVDVEALLVDGMRKSSDPQARDVREKVASEG